MLNINIKKWSLVFRLRFIFSLCLLIFVLLFLYLKIVPFGRIAYERDYSDWLRSGKGFIYGLTPSERTDLISGELPKLIGDPIYFSLFTPRTFDKVKIIIEYRDHLSADLPIIEAGVLTDKIVWNYDLKPLENKNIDYLRTKWSETSKEGVILLQKEKKYSSVQELENDLQQGNLIDCPQGIQNCLAVYNYPFSPSLKIGGNNIVTNEPLLIINQPLRGAHQFFFSLSSSILKLKFDFVDLNQDKDLDPIEINLYSGDQLLGTWSKDDINTAGELEEKEIEFNRTDLKPGIYKIELKISNDIVIKKIESSASQISFINKIWPVSSAGNLALYTDASYLQVKAFSPASLQPLKFGGKEFIVDEAYKQFYFPLLSTEKVKEISFKKDDLILENNGVFAWSRNSLINPSLTKVDRFFEMNPDIKYLIAGYTSPVLKNDFKVASVELNLKGAYRENGKYSLMISVPGLKEGNGGDNYLEIKNIRVELKGRTLWQKIFN